MNERYLISSARLSFVTGKVFPIERRSVNYVTFNNSYVTFFEIRRSTFEISYLKRKSTLKLFIKYMVSNRCKLAVKEELKKLGLHFIVVDLGEVQIMENITPDQREQLKIALHNSGLELMDDMRAVLIEKIKSAIIEMVHHSDKLIKVNFSDFLILL